MDFQSLGDTSLFHKASVPWLYQQQALDRVVCRIQDSLNSSVSSIWVFNPMFVTSGWETKLRFHVAVKRNDSVEYDNGPGCWTIIGWASSSPEALSGFSWAVAASNSSNQKLSSSVPFSLKGLFVAAVVHFCPLYVNLGRQLTCTCC